MLHRPRPRPGPGRHTAAEARLRALIEAQMPASLDWAMNLGKFDFFPSASGKRGAVAYLQCGQAPSHAGAAHAAARPANASTKWVMARV